MKILLSLALAALLAGPTRAQTQLVGTITGLGTRTVEYAYVRQGRQLTDSIRVVRDHFAQAVPAGDDGMGVMRFGDGKTGITSFALWVEPGTVRMRGTAEQLDRLDATGTPENNVLSEYNHDVAWKSSSLPNQSQDYYRAIRARRQQQTRQLIQTHPAARTSAYLLYEQMRTQPDYPVADYEQLAQALVPAVRRSWYGQAVAERLAVLRRQPTVGRPVPDFTIADTAGVQHSLATYRGQYVLLDFWGHWCHPCVQAMPKVAALHQQYAGRLAIIGVALEAASSAGLWKRAIRQYHVPGLQLSELQADEGPVIRDYNINAFPTYLLLDRQGRLIARTNDVDDITKKLTTLADL